MIESKFNFWAPNTYPIPRLQVVWYPSSDNPGDTSIRASYFMVLSGAKEEEHLRTITLTKLAEPVSATVVANRGLNVPHVVLGTAYSHSLLQLVAADSKALGLPLLVVGINGAACLYLEGEVQALLKEAEVGFGN